MARSTKHYRRSAHVELLVAGTASTDCSANTNIAKPARTPNANEQIAMTASQPNLAQLSRVIVNRLGVAIAERFPLCAHANASAASELQKSAKICSNFTVVTKA